MCKCEKMPQKTLNGEDVEEESIWEEVKIDWGLN